jgi:hypothetical protein
MLLDNRQASFINELMAAQQRNVSCVGESISKVMAGIEPNMRIDKMQSKKYSLKSEIHETNIRCLLGTNSI